MNENVAPSLLLNISLALRSFGFGLILVCLSQLNAKIGGINFSLSFLPAIALLFWHKSASQNWSLFFVFLLGLLQDMLSFGPTGLWAFSYLSIYLALNQELTNVAGFGRALTGIIIYISALLIPLAFVGRLFLGEWPSWIPLTASALATLLVFPLIYWLRYLFVSFRSAPSEREAN